MNLRKPRIPIQTLVIALTVIAAVSLTIGCLIIGSGG